MLVIFVIGLAVGSFLNVYIFRLRHAGSAWRGRSFCPNCKKPLSWYELIPLVSYLIQLGHCRGCKQKIDWQYPAVELATGLLFVLGIMNQELGIRVLIVWYLLSVLVVLFVYDLRFGLVPDRVALPAILIALALQFHNSYFIIHNSLVVSGYALAGVVIGSLFFAVQYYLSKGRWLGAGDIRIGALMGAMLGWPHILVGLVVSYMLGGLVGVALLATGRKKFGQTVPLGTFLTVGTAIIFLYGEQIWKMYWGI